MSRLIRGIAVALVAICATSLFAATETERLVTLARVWSTAKYFHPYFMHRDVKWDDALLRAIPRVRAANDDAAFDAAVAAMLAELGDPATRLDSPAAERIEGTSTEIASIGRLEGDTFVMRAGEAIEKAGPYGFRDLAEKGAEEIAKARYVIVDLRTTGRNAALWAVDDIGGSLTRMSVTAPARWTATYSGFATEWGTTSGGYYSGLTSFPGARYPASASATLEGVAFVVSAASQPPGFVLALRSSGRAVIVADAPLTDAAFAQTMEVPLGTGLSAIIRVDELSVEVAADAVVQSADPNAAITRARELLKNPSPAPLPSRVIPAPRSPVNDSYSAIADVPSLEMRLLAAIRLWSVIDRFYPYKPLIGDWDAAFAESIPRFIAASTRRDYVGAILELAAHVEDGHTTVSGDGIPQFFGPYFLPAEVRLVRGEPVVTALGNPAKSAGLRIGDVVRAVDGSALQDRVQRLRKFIAGSTEVSRTNRVLRYALRGEKDSVAKLQIERGTQRLSIEVPRSQNYALEVVEPETPAYRMLTDDIGYADLTRLKPAEVESMFENLGGAKNIIFDMRGYPKGTAWSIAPRLGSGEPRPAARFSRPQIVASDSYEMPSASFSFVQPLPDGRSLKRYGGRTYMLIDDRAISQAEHTGLFFETANGTEFIGTPSSGANGDVTSMVLPGALYVLFSGHEVRHANGEQLQRVGLRPALQVEPTVAGLQSGKDEVLDRAIEYVRSKR